MLWSRSMDPFVRRLVQRLNDPSGPLSRNRHFHTLETPEGKQALRISRRLKSIRRDILTCLGEGGTTRLARRVEADGEARLEISLERVGGRRVSILREAELELLAELPGMREVLQAVLDEAA
jgi:hypothetical protein